MTWGNYGKWHVDHIIPCAEFDLTKPEQQLRCFHYTNLQPLWAIDNFKKNKFSPANAQLAPPTLTDGRAVIAETMRP